MNLCDICSHRKGCDWLASFCLLTPAEVARKPELLTNTIRNKRHSERMNGAKRHKRRVWLRTVFQPDKSLAVKYDKRRKPDSPRRQWEREYRAKKRAEVV